MKKHDEGYALPFVLVVLVVLCIIAVAIMDTSLRNLEAQQSTIQRMQSKYEAAGRIEAITAAMQTPADDASEAFVFPGNKELPGNLSFQIIAGESFLRVAASHGPEEGEKDLWLIAALKPANLGGMLTGTETEEGNKITLTVKNCGSVQYLWYEVVDEDTAKQFLAGGYPTELSGEDMP